MKKILSVLVCVVALLNNAYSQDSTKVETPKPSCNVMPVSAEMLFGHDNMNFSAGFTKPFSEGSKFSLSTYATFLMDYDNNSNMAGGQAEMLIPISVSYSVYKGFGVFTGVTVANFWGVWPIAGVNYNYFSGDFGFYAQAGKYMTASNNFESLGFAQYTPKINDKWKLYSRVSYLYARNPESTSLARGLCYVRAGVTKGAYTFGLGMDWDMYNYGTTNADTFTDENIGVFLTVNLF